MSKLLMDERIFTTKYVPNHSRSRVLKSRENICKLKCNKSLKKKLKKYKLRKDGQEDPDIIDVSQTLISSLRIKSPNNQNFCCHTGSERNRPYNYLTKMVRLKKTATVIESTLTNIENCNTKIKDESLATTVDQDRKQTDAFKLLMESRNKSIGSNSPGKEKYEEESVVQEREESKKVRAKRILTLNRMAESKGSLKKLEIEEYREATIKRKMEDRAKRFKHMIVDSGGKSGTKDKKKIFQVDKMAEKSSNPITSNVIENTETIDIKSPTKTYDLFKDVKVNVNSNMREITKEDEEFLKKLSPSIRKKENMLCYFQKVSKESETCQDNTYSQNGDKLIVKINVKSRDKLRKSKKKHITDNVKEIIESPDFEPVTLNQCHVTESYDKSNKRKRNEKRESSQEEVTNDTNGTEQCHNGSRPKRNTKKPVKFTDDLQLLSSDEELHIFTPKKKRKEKLVSEGTSKVMVQKTEEKIKAEDCQIIEKATKTKHKKGRDIKRRTQKHEGHKNVVPKKATKLAPIFVSKPSLDSAAIEAKQKFLQSGVPSQLKKTCTNQSNILATNEFQKVVHIQQNKYIKTSNLSEILNVNYVNPSEDISLKNEKDPLKRLLKLSMIVNYNSMPNYQKKANDILQEIKKNYPQFPVYRTYHLLMGKRKGEFKDCVYPDLDNSVEIFNNMGDVNIVHPDNLNWADKYKPTTEKQVIGNFESIRELRRWLVTWTENDAKSKTNKCGSDSSDFYQSDTDSNQTMKNGNNLLIITGKVGTGKTLSVYAVAAELAIKVIEVNASTKRTGKIMLQDLQEATQSHKVDRSKSSTESSQKSQELCASNNLFLVKKKKGRKKKAKVDLVADVTKKDSTELIVSQDHVKTGMSLILIDDADIVFDQDDGFCYAISQLIQSSKRPVILVTSSLSCPHLQKFSCIAKIIKMRPFLPRMLGTWLDIMCLVDNTMCSPGLGAKTLDLFKGDIRRTINYLQFYMTSNKYLSNVDSPDLFQDDVSKLNVDDENSSTSWGDKNVETSNSNDICKYDINRESQFLPFWKPLNNFELWWNLPNLLNYSPNYCGLTFENLGKKDKTKEIKELDKIATVLDNMSMTDYFGMLNEDPSIISSPWHSFERDSVVDNENDATYNRSYDCINEISWEVMLKGIAEAQRVIDPESKTEMYYPSMSIQRERDRVVSRHETLTRCLNPSTALDRRALALDYWSSCRTICRTEKKKTNISSKRNNRFCHYLKSLNIVSKNEFFDSLAESLIFKK